MKQKGKFILFDHVAEFEQWLMPKHFSRAIRLVQNHHTYIPAYAHFTGSNHFALCESMEFSHLQRGFAEIAQHITTFPDGTLALCRSLEKIPAGIKGANQYGICIEHVGHFDTGGDDMTKAHKEAIVDLNGLFCRKFNLTPSINTIVYHHWYDLNTGQRRNGQGTTKSCPGTNFFGGNKVNNAQQFFIPLVQSAFLNGIRRPQPVHAPLRTVEVTAAKLNVRIQPNTTANIVKQLMKGAAVDVYEQQGEWLKIHPTESNWVSSKFVR